MVLQQNYLSGTKIQSIYLGGGTPSLLSQKEFEEIWESLIQNFDIAVDAEITLEANPDDLNNHTISQWKSSAVNRLSIGIQSFYDEDLRYMNRAHNAQEAEACVHIARDAGFTKLSIDLIYGTPTLSNDGWQKNLEWVTKNNIPHLSAYCLTVESRTPLHKLIKNGKFPAPDESLSAKQFEMLMEYLPQAGYEHYEISNLCKPGAYSIHNRSYWNNIPYLGLGPSAHSYNGKYRQHNIRNNNAYIRSILSNKIPAEIEILSQAQRCNEYLLTSLRTQWGCRYDRLLELAAPNDLEFIIKQASTFHTMGLVILDEHNNIILTNKGKLFSDHISGELFLDT